MSVTEINFDGLIGPTHNYAGLSFGNVASTANRDGVARPRAGALQGLAKMRLLMQRGLTQGVLPPVGRPDIAFLRALGFTGRDREVWEKAARTEPALARQALAASSMWTANAGTISPSADCADGRMHVSVANLSSMLHRQLEAPQTLAILKRLFADESRFAVHPALPPHVALGDEGAANHMRLWGEGGGVEVFVYGREAAEIGATRFPARQTLEASRAIARRHGLADARTLFVPQSATAIDAGAFHNDVVAVSHETVVFHHEQAFGAPWQDAVKRASDGLFEPEFVMAPASEVPLADAVASYLFNAQLVRFPGAARLALIAPRECEENARVRAYLERLTADAGPIGEVVIVDLRESMKNGGGPACLRLRVALTDREQAALTAGFVLDDAKIDALEGWVRRHYREELGSADLADPALVDEVFTALDELTSILPLGGGFYPFQTAGA